MNTKLSKEKLKSSIITSLLTVLLSFIFLYVAFFLIWYWIMPKLCVIIPPLKTYIESLNDSALPDAYNIVLSISSCIAIFPGAIISHSVSKKRKKEFLAYSNGRISYVNGIKFHIAEYGLSDIISISLIIIVSVILFLVNGTGFFPIAFYMLKNLGVVLGLIVTILWVTLSIFFGIFFSQKKWKVQHFIDE